jgi:hypothetical protein
VRVKKKVSDLTDDEANRCAAIEAIKRYVEAMLRLQDHVFGRTSQTDPYLGLNEAEQHLDSLAEDK